LAHVPRGRLREEEGAADVDAEEEVEVARAELERRLRLGEAGVVDEDVEPAERPDRLAREPVRHLRVGEVAVHPVDGPELVEAPLRLLVLGTGVLSRVAEREAIAEQPLGDRVADPAVRAGDECDPSQWPADRTCAASTLVARRSPPPRSRRRTRALR